MNNLELYTKYKLIRESLAKTIGDASNIINKLDMTEYSMQLKDLSKKVNTDTFKIQVVGTFKNGKSTFINALLGYAALPAYSLPCTAVINEVKYGDKKRAILHFLNPLPEHLSKSIPANVMSHMKKYGMKNIPPLEIPYDQIEQCVVIPIGKDPQESILESPFSKVELFWPLDLLKEGVEIIDSPGLNEHMTRTKVTMGYLKQADAILFVFDATHICASDEIDFIEGNLYNQGFTDPFFIVNRWDQIPEQERNMMMIHAKQKLNEYSSNEIFYMSSLQALQSKQNNDEAMYETSGLKKFEKALINYLTNHKGKAKLAQPARDLKRILSEEALYKVIPRKRMMLESSLDDLKKRYADAKPRIDVLHKKKEQIVLDMMMKIEQSKSQFRRLSLANTEKLSNLIPSWIDAYNPKTQLGITAREEKVNTLIKEVTNFVHSKVEKYQRQWKDEILLPEVEERVKYIFESSEKNMSDLYSEIDKINMQFTGKVECNPNTVPVWERVATAAGGLLVGDLGLAASGGINGFSKELAKTAVFEIGAGALLFTLGLLNPITLIAILASAFLFNWQKGMSNVMKKAKEQIKNAICNQLVKNANDTADEMAENVANKFKKVAEQVSTAIDSEINAAEEQVKSIISELEKGQSAVNSKKEVINKCEEEIKRLDKSLNEIIFVLVGK